MKTRVVCATFVALVMACAQSQADPCSAITLPKQIQQKLATDYAAWRIVTPDVFDSDDRELY